MCTLWIICDDGEWFDIALGDLHSLIKMANKQSAKWQITDETQVLFEGPEMNYFVLDGDSIRGCRLEFGEE